MRDMIDKTYLPFAAEELKRHFIADASGQIDYYRKSACRYHKFMDDHPDTKGIPLRVAKTPRQIEKDERFWTITATKNVFDHPSRKEMLTQLLTKTFGSSPPIQGLGSWGECIDGDLQLFFEACLPSPQSYVKWLRANLQDRQIIPYVLDAANCNKKRALEGATHVDAMFLNVTNGFAWLIETKVLSDLSCSISFDNYRNQIARNIDVMLDRTSLPGSTFERRDPERSLFSLLTPMSFKHYPSSRLYGWLMHEYRDNPNAFERDLPHRKGTDWAALQKRIGWVTFEDFNEARPGACPWL